MSKRCVWVECEDRITRQQHDDDDEAEEEDEDPFIIIIVIIIIKSSLSRTHLGLCCTLHIPDT